MTSSQSYDAVILGGGLAGLCLAIQLKKARPGTSILVAEKNEHPVSEAAHKVGEAMGEAAANYFGFVVGMQEHLETQQLPKLGLRFFFPAGDNTDIAKRAEMGQKEFLPTPAYLLDRGRFENALGYAVKNQGIDFLDRCKVEQVSLGTGGNEHTIRLQREGRDFSVQARWLIDASGRAAILKRQLGLAKASSHDSNATWFRIGDRLAVDEWSDDPDWQGRMPKKQRWLSVCHFLGRGYWVWLIALSSGSHSVGIVTDPKLHPFEELNTFERAMDWLQRHEPQLAKEIETRRDLRLDFRVLKHYAYDCEQLYSTDRWCLTGEAGVFPDPLYSPGSDFITYSNTYITDMVTRELDGEDISERVELYNFFMVNAFQTALSLFEGNYPLFGNPQIMIAKQVWDVSNYYGHVALPYFRRKNTDLDFLPDVLPDVARATELGHRMQAFLREWDELDRREWPGVFVDQITPLDYLFKWQEDLLVDCSDEELKVKMAENRAVLESVAAEIFRKAARLVADVPLSQPIDPYVISLKPERWETDGLFTNPDVVAHNPEIASALRNIWLDEVKSEVPS